METNKKYSHYWNQVKVTDLFHFFKMVAREREKMQQ